MTCKRGRGGVGGGREDKGEEGEEGVGREREGKGEEEGRGEGRERGGKGGREAGRERGEGEGTHFLELLLLSSDLLLEGCHHPLVCLSPKHFVRLSARSKVCTLHEEETS